jgi:hypothetical protein
MLDDFQAVVAFGPAIRSIQRMCAMYSFARKRALRWVLLGLILVTQ